MALLHDTTLRCKGWCQEEQTLLQVRATGCSSTTLGIGPHLSWKVTPVKVTPVNVTPVKGIGPHLSWSLLIRRLSLLLPPLPH